MKTKLKLTETQKRKELVSALQFACQDFMSIANFNRTGQPQRATDLALSSWESSCRVLKELSK